MELRKKGYRLKKFQEAMEVLEQEKLVAARTINYTAEQAEAAIQACLVTWWRRIQTFTRIPNSSTVTTSCG